MPPSSANPATVVLAACHTLGPIGAAVVLLWVGLWGLLDTYLFPEDPTLSAAACVGVATVLALICHAWASSSVPRDNAAYAFLTATLAVCYWRGVWKLWQTLVFVDIPLIQSLLALALGIGILVRTGNFKATVVGPPILFPQPKLDHFTPATVDRPGIDHDLTTPLHADFNDEEMMIALTDVE